MNSRQNEFRENVTTVRKYKSVTIGNREIKVAVRTPENARNSQEKINQIYDILKPVS